MWISECACVDNVCMLKYAARRPNFWIFTFMVLNSKNKFAALWVFFSFSKRLHSPICQEEKVEEEEEGINRKKKTSINPHWGNLPNYNNKKYYKDKEKIYELQRNKTKIKIKHS